MTGPLRRLRRWRARLELDRVDAEVAHWYVADGTLSVRPLGRAGLSQVGVDLRRRRLEAVRRLESAGGHDPAPTLLRQPTDAQRAAHA